MQIKTVLSINIYTTSLKDVIAQLVTTEVNY